MNTIIIELCAEDRARLDKLTAALDRRSCDSCVATALEIMGERKADPVQKALAETLARAEQAAEAPKKAAETAEPETPTTAPETKEEPAAAKDASDAPAVKLEEIQQKIVAIAARTPAKKGKAREIINAFGAKKVSDLKDTPDKWPEVWDKLIVLEQEG